jgi:uncharacterized membrane protein
MRMGLTVGSGMLLGLLVGLMFFGKPALGMVVGLLVGAAVAAARRRSSAPGSH